ncbi:hypothetical protein [Spirosoma validum]|uniref:Uncharacterized protein n=1 Tax=Spirosoma validum TaxID=2771355 RepID=A0A927B8I3_9BACT|nr:hypothetical protein [Spirosoma validum]MBD2757684.1 hypothetical protein [Spirosoma validum]
MAHPLQSGLTNRLAGIGRLSDGLTTPPDPLTSNTPTGFQNHGYAGA